MSFDPDMDSSFNSKQDDTGCYATFFLHPIIDGFKSKEAGREIYTEVPYILILVKGQNKTEVRRKATDEDKRRFPREWRAFEEGKANPITGTPLESLNLATGIIQELKHLNIRTVEDVADMSDLTIQKIGIGGVEMRNQAQAFLSKNSVKVLELTQMVEAQAKQIAELKAMIENKVEPIKRGRPRKDSHVSTDHDAGNVQTNRAAIA